MLSIPLVRFIHTSDSLGIAEKSCKDFREETYCLINASVFSAKESTPNERGNKFLGGLSFDSFARTAVPLLVFLCIVRPIARTASHKI